MIIHYFLKVALFFSFNIYANFKLYYVPEDQTVLIIGNESEFNTIIILQYVHEIEQKIVIMKCSDTMFELIYSGINTFLISTNYFNTLDFTNVPIQNKLLEFS